MRPPEFDNVERTRAAKLVNLILWLLFAAALITAPLFFVGESFSQTHLVRVLLSNGGTAIGALGLALATTVVLTLRASGSALAPTAARTPPRRSLPG